MRAGNQCLLVSTLQLPECFWLAAGCSLLLVIMIQFVGDRGEPIVTPQTATTKHHIRIVQPRVIPVALILLLFSLPYFATQTYIVSYVAARHFHVAAGVFSRCTRVFY